MLDTRKSGLLQQSPPSMSRTELFIQQQGGEVKQAVRSRRHSYLDKDSLAGKDTSRLHSETGEFGTPAAPTISGHPRLSNDGSTVPLGSNFSLTCGAASSIGVTYQWQLDAGDIVGAVNPTIEVIGAGAPDAGVYTCDVTNATGTTSSQGATVIVV